MTLGAIAAHFVASSAYPTLVLASGPDLYLRCRDTAGPLADSSGNGRNANVGSANPTFGYVGAISNDSDTAIAFPGLHNAVTSFAAVPWGAWMNRSTFTAVVWFKTTDTGLNYLLTRWGGATSGEIWGLDLQSSNVVRGYAKIAGTNRILTATVTGLRDGNWHMAVLTYDGSILRLYVDGSIVSSLSVSGALQTSLTSEIRPAHRVGMANGEQHNGQLDEISFGPVINPTGISDLWAAR